MPFDFTEMLKTNVGRSTIGFVEKVGTEIVSRGSGTLIKFGQIGGILTCAHVLEYLSSLEEFGIVYFPVRAGDFQTMSIARNKTSEVVLGASPWTATGPDLAFLRLSDVEMGALSSVAFSVNADFHRANAKDGEPKYDSRVDLVCGVIGEWTREAELSEKLSKTTIEALLNVGQILGVSQENGFDILRFKPVPSDDFKTPTSYKGTSGGGLWRIFVSKNDDDTYKVVQRRLVGVAFWETEDRDEIKCHGQQSVYKNLFDAIEAKWPAS